MSFEQQWIEYDFNPFLLFDTSGKLISLNAEAQFLLGAIKHQELFKLATTYASRSFGFKSTFMDLEYGRFKFFGVMVGYESEERIGIRLYQTPTFKLKDPDSGGEMVDLYALLDLCISSSSINLGCRFVKILDPTMPDVKLKIESFTKVLNAIFRFFSNSKTITIKLSFRVGEYIKFGEKRYSFYSLSISSDEPQVYDNSTIKALCEDASLYYEIHQQEITINIPIQKG